MWTPFTGPVQFGDVPTMPLSIITSCSTCDQVVACPLWPMFYDIASHVRGWKVNIFRIGIDNAESSLNEILRKISSRNEGTR